MATIGTAIQVDGRMSGTLRAMNNALDIAINNFSELQDAIHNTVSSIQATRTELARVENTFNQIENSIRGAEQSQEQFNRSLSSATPSANNLLGKLKQMVVTVGKKVEVGTILNLSDEISRTNARLNLMNDGMQTTAELQGMIFQSAQRSRGSYSEMVKTVGMLGIGAKDTFSSNEETIAFVEQMNKHLVIGGADAQEMAAVSLQISEALSSGTLSGDEFNSVFAQAPTIIHTIADYLNVPIDMLSDMASEGEITASIIKNAMLAAAEETNAKFENIPITFGQAMTTIKDDLLMTFEPLFQIIGAGATLLHDNWSTLEPVFWGLAAAVGSFAFMTGLQAVATWLSVAANRALITTMLANPLLWIAVIIGVVVAAIYKWVQAVGGIEIAWMMVSTMLMYQWDLLKINFLAVVYGICGLIDMLVIAFQSASVGVQNWCGDMKAGALQILQDMTNGAIDIINEFINTLNNIPGVAIETIEHVTFAASYATQNEAEKQARNESLAVTKANIYEEQQRRQEKVTKMGENAQTLYNQRFQEVADAQAKAEKRTEDNSADNYSSPHDYSSPYDDGSSESALGDTTGNTGKKAYATETSKEDLQYLRDKAERETINRFTTAEIKVEMGGINNTVNKMNDLDGIPNYIATAIEQQMQITAEGVHE